jgi:hypothetical protein
MLHLLFSHVAEPKAIHPGVQRSICSGQRQYLQAVQENSKKVRQKGSTTVSLGQLWIAMQAAIRRHQSESAHHTLLIRMQRFLVCCCVCKGPT